MISGGVKSGTSSELILGTSKYRIRCIESIEADLSPLVEFRYRLKKAVSALRGAQRHPTENYGNFEHRYHISVSVDQWAIVGRFDLFEGHTRVCKKKARRKDSTGFAIMETGKLN